MAQIKNTYNELKDDFRAKAKNEQRQKRMQQIMLAKHYKHQKDILKQRHKQLLNLKQQIQNIQSYEHNLQQRHETLVEIQKDFNKRKAKLDANSQLLQQRKKEILNEMQKFNQLTQNMSKLNLSAIHLTEQQKKELDEFIAQHPETTVDDYSYHFLGLTYHILLS